MLTSSTSHTHVVGYMTDELSMKSCSANASLFGNTDNAVCACSNSGMCDKIYQPCMNDSVATGNMHNGTTQGMHMCAVSSHALSTKVPRTEDVKLGIVPDVPNHVH